MSAKTYNRYKLASGMDGPYDLTRANLSRLPDLPGVYLMAEFVGGGGPIVRYVGRAVDLTDRPAHGIGKYEAFYFVVAEDEFAAFKIECREYHRYGKSESLDNKIHPAVPAGYGGKRCNQTGCNGESY